MIRWNEPRFNESDIAAVTRVLEDNYVNEGPKTRELEVALEKYLNVKHVTMVANGTAALFLAVNADAIIRGISDYEVLVPDMTMIASATAVNWAGGTPVLVDVTESNATINTDGIEKYITPKTSAIMPVHILGRSSNMPVLEQLANEHNLTIIEDAAGALGSKNSKGYLGTQGKVGCFSMQSNKIITSGQGGFVVTNDPQYHEVMRRIRDFGRFSNKEFLHESVGYNLKFSDLAASLALSQFRRIEEKKKYLVDQSSRYRENLSSLDEVRFFDLTRDEVPLWVDIIAKDRNNLVECLKSQGISTRDYWPAIHRNPPYEARDYKFPVASKIADHGLWLPNGPGVSLDNIDLVCREIKKFYS